MVSNSALAAVAAACALLGAGATLIVRPAPAPPPVPALSTGATAAASGAAAPAGPAATSSPVAPDVPSATLRAAPAGARGASGAPERPDLVAMRDLVARMESLRTDARIRELGARVDRLAKEAAALSREAMRIGGVDFLAERLDLDARDRATVAAVVRDATRALADLRRTPDDAGKTWEAVQREGVRWEDGVRVVDDGEALAFRDRAIPGRADGATFGAEEGRILRDAARRVGEGLGPAHAEALRGLDLGLLFGPLPPGAPEEPVTASSAEEAAAAAAAPPLPTEAERDGAPEARRAWGSPTPPQPWGEPAPGK